MNRLAWTLRVLVMLMVAVLVAPRRRRRCERVLEEVLSDIIDRVCGVLRGRARRGKRKGCGASALLARRAGLGRIGRVRGEGVLALGSVGDGEDVKEELGLAEVRRGAASARWEGEDGHAGLAHRLVQDVARFTAGTGHQQRVRPLVGESTDGIDVDDAVLFSLGGGVCDRAQDGFDTAPRSGESAAPTVTREAPRRAASAATARGPRARPESDTATTRSSGPTHPGSGTLRRTLTGTGDPGSASMSSTSATTAEPPSEATSTERGRSRRASRSIPASSERVRASRTCAPAVASARRVPRRSQEARCS